MLAVMSVTNGNWCAGICGLGYASKASKAKVASQCSPM